jgi:hypothetical protein
MTISTLKNEVERIKRELVNLEHQLADETDNEARNSQKLMRVLRNIGSHTTEFSLKSGLNDIRRYGNEITLNQKKRAELQKKIVKRRSELLVFEQRIVVEGNKNSIGIIFDFPIEIKEPCEQYLIYFTKFLKDSGINAASNLKEEAGKVLFSVTPKDDVEALDKIRKALAIYLNLPSSPIIYNESFAAMRLHQQIENLQHSQRMLVRELQFNEKLLIAQSEIIHEKNIIISQQQSVIEQQSKIIEKLSSKSIMMDSLENKEELEKIYDGLEIGFSKWIYELTGIKVNPTKMIKTSVKNILSGEEIISILDSDEETDKK